MKSHIFSLDLIICVLLRVPWLHSYESEQSKLLRWLVRRQIGVIRTGNFKSQFFWEKKKKETIHPSMGKMERSTNGITPSLRTVWGVWKECVSGDYTHFVVCKPLIKPHPTYQLCFLCLLSIAIIVHFKVSKWDQHDHFTTLQATLSMITSGHIEMAVNAMTV